MRIIHVLNDLSTFKTHRQALVDHFSKDHEVILLVPDHLDSASLIAQGYKVQGYPLSRKGLNPLQELKTLISLRALYVDLKPDLVHHFTIKPVIYGTLAARTAKVPKIINTITGLGYVFTGAGLIPKILRPVVERLYRQAFRSPRVRVIFQNQDDLELFVSRGLLAKEQGYLVPGSGVDTDRFIPAPEPPAPPYRVILPARMLWDKGIKEFVEAARLIRRERQDVEFELVGSKTWSRFTTVPISFAFPATAKASPWP